MSKKISKSKHKQSKPQSKVNQSTQQTTQQPPAEPQQQPAQPSNGPYKYPVRFFYGPSLTHLPKDILAKILSYFHSNKLTNSPIIGKINIPGISMDFNFGLRIEIPPGEKYHIQVRDYYNEIILFNEEIENTTLISAEKFFVQ